MKRHLLLLAALLISHVSLLTAAEPLRVFIRAGKKSHGPGAHDFPQFLKEWVPMLNERGAKCDGSLEFPTKEQLDKTDVLILHAQEAGNIKIGDERKNLMEFLARGGGLVSSTRRRCRRITIGSRRSSAARGISGRRSGWRPR
jgi:hypothetical protein